MVVDVEEAEEDNYNEDNTNKQDDNDEANNNADNIFFAERSEAKNAERSEATPAEQLDLLSPDRGVQFQFTIL